MAQQKDIVAHQKHVSEALNFVFIDLEEALRPPSDSAKVSKGDAADFRRRLMEVYDNLPDKHGEVCHAALYASCLILNVPALSMDTSLPALCQVCQYLATAVLCAVIAPTWYSS